MNIGIIGLGLMGGSAGLALKNSSFTSKIIGVDHNALHQQEALELGLVDTIGTLEDMALCDIIIFTIPVESIITVLHALPSIKEDATIIDFGSTKAKIITHIPPKLRANFVAAHPMTGTEKCGPSASFASLYTNKVVVLCDLEASGAYQQSIARQLFEELNMRIITMDSQSHDRHVAYISHLPHAISFALANTVLAQEDKRSILNLAAGGFKDMSRLAKSSPHMWEDVFKQNKQNVLDSIEVFEKELQFLKASIQNETWEELNYKMSHANSLHEIL